MMKSTKFLADLSEMTGKSDRQLALQLNVTHSSISQYRSGKRIMDNEACIAVALALGIDPMKVIMAADMDRAERSGQQSLWEVFTQRMAKANNAILATNEAEQNLSYNRPRADVAQLVEQLIRNQ
jgi:transcriptional regulator with XRE-family HTH domain